MSGRGGYQAGKRLIAASQGANKGACIDHQPGALNLAERCQGFFAALRESGIAVETVEISSNPVESQKLLKTYISEHPETNIFLTLGPEAAAPFYRVLQDLELSSDRFSHGTFDLSRTILNPNQSGDDSLCH